MQDKVSFIIPVGPGLKPDVCVDSLRKLNHPKELLEVLVAEGRSPSKQRNLAVKESGHGISYFLDDDVVVDPDILKHVLPHFGRADVAVVGGPMMSPQTDPLLARCFGYTMESYIGSAGMRYRFKPIGQAQEADETHMVLCNLSCRREVYLREGGLRGDLYPNEENEFFNRLLARGHKMIYEPKAIVYHSRASTIPKIIRKNIGYGRGRMEQTIIQPSSFRPVFAMPTLFAAYLITIPAALAATGSPYYIMPLMVYLFLTGLESLKTAWRRREPMVFCAMWLLYPLIHVSYGAGFVWGLLKRVMAVLPRMESEVDVRRVRL
jgi:succinoglycan biosynthesis protein ExoA